MPCAAGSLCASIPVDTPGPPLFTFHKCRVCGSYFLHGLCGLPDPLEDKEMQRVCHGCINSNNHEESSADPAAGAASSKRLRPERQETGKEKQAGALDSLKGIGNTAARKARGADTRKRPTFGQQVEALDLLKSMSGTAIAAKLGIGVSTLYAWKAKEADISKKEAASTPGAKSTKGAEFAKVGASWIILVLCILFRVCILVGGVLCTAVQQYFNSEYFGGLFWGQQRVCTACHTAVQQ